MTSVSSGFKRFPGKPFIHYRHKWRHQYRFCLCADTSLRVIRILTDWLKIPTTELAGPTKCICEQSLLTRVSDTLTKAKREKTASKRSWPTVTAKPDDIRSSIWPCYTCSEDNLHPFGLHQHCICHVIDGKWEPYMVSVGLAEYSAFIGHPLIYDVFKKGVTWVRITEFCLLIAGIKDPDAIRLRIIKNCSP